VVVGNVVGIAPVATLVAETPNGLRPATLPNTMLPK
jgi:hypothetical protein